MLVKICEELTYWGQVFLLPIYGLSHLMPRDKKIWLFGSTFGRRFADNPRYFYLYMSRQKEKGVKAVWVTRNKEIVRWLLQNGYEAVYAKSLKGIWYCLRGGVYLYDNYSKDISFWLSGGAVKVNLWHGVGNKKINHDNLFDRVRHPQNKWERFRYALRRLSDEKPCHYTVATSPVMAEIFKSAFGTDSAHIIQAGGYPRNDMLFPDGNKMLCTEAERQVGQKIAEEKKKGSKILMYMPTFRESEELFFDIMNLQEFNSFLKKENYFLFTKLHPKSKLKEQFELLHHSNIVNISADADVYTFLSEVELLITDYSSIYSDYLMLDRPSVLFWYDFEEYSHNTRDCYFDFNEYMPERTARTMPELMREIKLAMQKDGCSEKRLAVRSWMFSEADGNSSERLYGKIKEIL